MVHESHDYAPTRQSHSVEVYPAEEYDLDHAGHLNVHLASIAEKKKLWWKNAIINAAFITSWFLFATVLSLYNKWMFSPEHLGFGFPLFVTTLHMFVQFALAALLRLFWPGRFRPPRSPSRADYGKKAAPTAIATSLDIGLSNLSLKTITLSFYTMCKSSSLIFVLLFAFLFRLEKFSFRLVGVIFLIFCGVLLMVATETHFIFTGFILVISASALGGFRWSLTQLLLKDKKMGMDNPAATVYWLAPAMGVTIGIVSAIVENWVVVFQSPHFSGLGRILRTIIYLISPGVVAFCMVMSEFYIIQRVGVVPMSIAGIAKEVTTITLSAWFFGDQLTPLNVTGVGITACGIALFTFHKYRKSIESTVPLDAHGNPITPDDLSDIEDGGYTTALRETETLTSQASQESECGLLQEFPSDNARLLFSEDEGEGDAEELRSIRSSKVRQYSGYSGAKTEHEEQLPLVSEDSGHSRAQTDL